MLENKAAKKTSTKKTTPKGKTTKVKTKKITKLKNKSTKSTKSTKSKNKKIKEEPFSDMGVVIVDDDIKIDQEKINEERRAYLEEAKSQEATD